MTRVQHYTFRPGQPVPDVTLGRLVDEVVRAAPLRQVVAGKRVALIGVTGAFTPICTRDHVPGFVEHAEELRRARFDLVLCIAPNDPWTVAAWAKKLDPEGKVTFMSDGNLDLARSIGAMRSERGLFMGERPSRYLAVLDDGIVGHLRIEPTVDVLTCTAARHAVVLD